MKLAFICTEKLPAPAIKGGAIQMMIDGVSPFLSEKHDLTIFSISDKMLHSRETINRTHYIRFPRENYRNSVAEELKNHSFDVIHVFNRPKNIELYKQASPSSRIVLSLHNDMFLERKISDELGKKAINLTTKITTVSEYIKNRLIARFPEAEKKITVMYSGVDLKMYPPIWTKQGSMIRQKYREKYGIGDKKVILFVGRLSKTKGPHILIHTLKKLVKENNDIVLVITGGKWFSDNRLNDYVRYLYKLAEPLKEHIIFTKFIPPDEIPNIFLMADVFVCSSQWNEPLARVNYEAMAAGIPLITTNRGGNGEVVMDQQTGIIINDYNNPSAYVKAIQYLIDNPSYANWMAKNGRSFIETNFDFKHVAERLEKVYIDAYEESVIKNL
ncbi:glycosyltransferase family 4 protein [Ferdinandcohnia sp. SAFN-114]|uniref:glycosyltransferase family 4 protein n=1 Tax=Ferdinandcohnia sp. SAFN-114 TaxID=3387275 RepID=UPI003F8187B4